MAVFAVCRTHVPTIKVWKQKGLDVFPLGIHIFNSAILINGTGEPGSYGVEILSMEHKKNSMQLQKQSRTSGPFVLGDQTGSKWRHHLPNRGNQACSSGEGGVPGEAGGTHLMSWRRARVSLGTFQSCDRRQMIKSSQRRTRWPEFTTLKNGVPSPQLS